MKRYRILLDGEIMITLSKISSLKLNNFGSLNFDPTVVFHFNDDDH